MTNRVHRHPLAPKIPDSIKKAAYDPKALDALTRALVAQGFGK
jgi:hypothetical protein